MTLEELCKIKEDYADNWMKYDDVYGVGVGYKTKGGKKTDEIGIIVYTTQKKPKNRIAAEQILPDAVEGALVDVVEAPMPAPFIADVSKDRSDCNMYRPMVGGIQLCHLGRVEGSKLRLSMGTLGMFVKSKDDPGGLYLLTNWHVLEQLKMDIYQPMYDGSRSSEVYVAVAEKGDYYESADAGIAKLSIPQNQVRTNAIIEVGEIRGVYGEKPTLGQMIKKRGRTTGLTFGKVTDIDMDVFNGVNTFKHQVMVTGFNNKGTVISDHGDSGSIVLSHDDEIDEKNNYVMGLLWGGNSAEDSMVYSPIEYVFKSLNIEMCSGT